jgi:hypothetical protein
MKKEDKELARFLAGLVAAGLIAFPAAFYTVEHSYRLQTLHIGWVLKFGVVFAVIFGALLFAGKIVLMILRVDRILMKIEERLKSEEEDRINELVEGWRKSGQPEK